MKQVKISILLLLIFAVFGCSTDQKPKEEFQASFESLEKVNPVPEWFKDAKFGIYFHWGVYSVPAYANEWYPRAMYIEGSAENKHHKEVYGDPTEWPYNYFISGAQDKYGNFVQFAPKLKSEGGNFDPEEWAQLFADAGAKFAGPVAEHHDGFSLWDSDVNPWNAMDMGPHLDLVGLLTHAIRKHDMKVFLSMHHAFNITGYYSAVPKTDDPQLKILFGQQDTAQNESLWLNKHKEVIDKYKPDIIYQDFNLHLISQNVLLEFLAYYYNKAASWNKEVVATFKDGLNTKCAVLDYERGGPPDLTDNYWLTDDALSSSSWCYTEGIEYYSKSQILHAFIDRISKNGSMILNISPKADGTIPQEQKDILLSMGSWLKKYGEAIYNTRAWEKYGEGPTRMGAAHGIMGAPVVGTSKDIRYTRSKDHKTLFAIMLGWEEGEKELILKSLSSERIDLQNLESVELINNKAGDYLSLAFEQDKEGLKVALPERSFEEMAYVLKLNFKGEMHSLDRFAELDCTPYYRIVPADNMGDLVMEADLTLSKNRKDLATQWKLQPAGKGIYKIVNREETQKMLTCSLSDQKLIISDQGGENQLWKIEDAHSELYSISNVQFPDKFLSLTAPSAEGIRISLSSGDKGTSTRWKLLEVCETRQVPYKKHTIPGTIEAEDYDVGCPDEAYQDKDIENTGRKYRLHEGVDIEVCSTGGYNVGWTNAGEWMAYTLEVKKSATYEVSFYLASNFDSAKLHLECDGENITGDVPVPNTSGFQSWVRVKKTVKLEAGKQVLKLVVDGGYLNIDKMVFKVME